MQSSHWFKAHNEPPTYFPKGVSADHPTTAGDGMWVMSGDAKGTRYFIPVRGVDTHSLIAEAQSNVTPEKRKQVAKGGGGGDADVRGAAAGIFGSTVTGLTYLLLEVDQVANRQGGGIWNPEPHR